MRRQGKKLNPIESVETLASFLKGFDYGVADDDFVLYELVGLINEDRASLDDADFRRLIDEGVRAHIEENRGLRARLARSLRVARSSVAPETQTIADRVIRAVEDMEASLTNAGVIVRSYIAYLFARLDSLPPELADAENLARSQIERWQSGEILRQQLLPALRSLNRAAITPAAELLLDSAPGRLAAETALEVLVAIPCAASARFLAHAVAEPLLDEDLELRAVSALESMWPLARNYVLYSLRGHTHEDIPFRWFEILARSDDPAVVDLTLDEVRVHGDSPAFREDLASILDTLHQSRDPELEDKVVAVLNTSIPAAAQELLQSFLQHYRKEDHTEARPWAAIARQRELDQAYLRAARLFDQGRTEEAVRDLQEILRADPEHPFARMLSELVP